MAQHTHHLCTKSVYLSHNYGKIIYKHVFTDNKPQSVIQNYIMVFKQRISVQ